jgi:hypothetical protein
MNRSDAGGQLAVMYEPHLLPSESQGRYRALRDAMLAEFKPRNAIEEMWICELIHGEWEMQRLHGFKATMIASARRPALKNLLSIALDASGAADVDELAERFFTNKAVRKKVIDILSKYGMTEASIDTEAFRHCLVEIGAYSAVLACARTARWIGILRSPARPARPTSGCSRCLPGVTRPISPKPSAPRWR